jgi:4-hydroxythreonine-4-phosphate dehydrogenase
MNPSTPILGITVGDPAGIGPEISVACAAQPQLVAQARAVLYSDPVIIRRTVDIMGLPVTVRLIDEPAQAVGDPTVIDVVPIGVVDDAARIEYGRVQDLGGRSAVAAIERAVTDAMAGRTNGIVTGPLNKEAIWAAGSDFLGHTEMLQELTGAAKTDTMFVVDDLCTFFATRHMSLGQAVAAIKADSIEASIERAMTALRVFGHNHPRFAVAALNPHGGENGHFGREEIDEIRPAIDRYNARTGENVAGPIPADSVFHLGLQGAFDGILSLYHDQGHIATKTYNFDETVSVTVCLPILRTSVDHGTAFDIAGQGRASAATMIAAYKAGIKFSTRNDAIARQYGVSAKER